MARRKLELHWQILIGMAAGLVVGLVLNLLQGPIGAATEASAVFAAAAALATGLVTFLGDLFLRSLQFIAVPIVLFSLIVGASSLSDLKKLSRVGGRTVAIYIGTTAVAISLGLVFANLFAPGTWVSDGLRDQLAASGAAEAAAKVSAAAAPSAWQVMLDVVPSNPFASIARGEMLQVVFTALAVGVALTLIPREKAEPVIRIADGLTDVVIKLVHLVMLAAPVAVFALIVRVVASMGLEVLGALLVYSLTVVAGLGVMIFGVYPLILRTLGGVPARRFFRAIAPAQLLGFSSSSSSATLPVTMECVEERLGVGEDITSFVIPLGATINMDGTALYQGVAAVFIAQMYGIDLDLAAQVTIVLTATLASIGTAGVPGVGIVMLVIVLQSVGMPEAAMTGGIAIIFGVDRLLDMCRTTCNITGDCMVAGVVASMEGELRSEAEVLAGAAAPARVVGLDEQA